MLYNGTMIKKLEKIAYIILVLTTAFFMYKVVVKNSEENKSPKPEAVIEKEATREETATPTTTGNASTVPENQATDATKKEEPETKPQESKKTVLDYYYELPNKYFMGGADNGFSRQEREKSIQTKDIANYFVSFYPPYVDGPGTVTVFVTPEKEHLIAVETKGCGPGCEQELYFLKYQNGNWKDVTSEVSPRIDTLIPSKILLLQNYLKNRNPQDATIGNLLYKLPRYGTTIEYYDQFSGIVLLKWHWKKGKFTVEEVSLENQIPYWEREE